MVGEGFRENGCAKSNGRTIKDPFYLESMTKYPVVSSILFWAREIERNLLKEQNVQRFNHSRSFGRSRFRSVILHP